LESETLTIANSVDWNRYSQGNFPENNHLLTEPRAIVSSLNLDPISTEMGLIKTVDYDNWSAQMVEVSGSCISKDLAGRPVQPDTGQV
jgi:hypothetical protein